MAPLQDCRTMLERFTGAVGKQTLMTEMTAPVLPGYRAGLMIKQYAPSTVNRHVLSIRSLLGSSRSSPRGRLRRSSVEIKGQSP